MWAMGKWIIDSVISGFGAANASGGSSSSGSIMSKLNKLLTDWTTTRAGYIDTINSSIGSTSNTGGSTTAGTVMGKLNAVISGNASVSSVASSANTNAANANSNAANAYSVLTNGTYGLNAIYNKLPANWQMQVVKSVQRGIYSGVNGYSSNGLKITISSVDPGKCLVSILPGVSSYTSSTGDSYNYTPYIKSLEPTLLTVSDCFTAGTSSKGSYFSWEIVEYY